MTARHIDCSALKTAFRAACTRRGIDPLAGATGYQLATLRADKARRTPRPDPCWWQNHELWLISTPDHSEVEREALWNVFHAASLHSLPPRPVHIIHSQNHALTAREVHAARGERLVWVELGDGQTTTVLRPLNAGERIAIEETVGYTGMDELQRRAVRLRLLGENYTYIAATLGVSKARVQAWIRDYFLRNQDTGLLLYEPPHYRHDGDVRRMALEMHAAECSQADIAEALQLPASTVGVWIRAARQQ